MNRGRQRIDVLLVERGIFDSRERARRAVMAGLVTASGQRVDKPGTMVNEDADIVVKEDPVPYVSRGGLKLEKAFREFSIDISGEVVLDIGASTGGFTDCMLKHGARLVYSVDVGYGQLAWQLRQDPRVVVMERTNARYLEQDKFDPKPTFATFDVSFISLEKVIPAALGVMDRPARLVCLIKPQFEAGPEKVGKKGVVRDPEVHREVIRRVLDFAAGQGLAAHGLTYSPVRGPEGNIEYLAYFKTGSVDSPAPIPVGEIVSSAHADLI